MNCGTLEWAGRRIALCSATQTTRLKRFYNAHQAFDRGNVKRDWSIYLGAPSCSSRDFSLPIMPNYYSEKIYEGPETIVVAMDIGTTQSEQRLSGWSGPDPLFLAAVSFAHLRPGSQPQGKMVL
jgi:hypothetical protein